MRTFSTTRTIAPLMLTLLLAILTIACAMFGPSQQDLANQTAVAVLGTIDKYNDELTTTADASNRRATATEAALTARAIMATQKAKEKEEDAATANANSTATAGPALAEDNAPAGWKLKLYDPFADNALRWPTGADTTNQWVREEQRIKDDHYVMVTTAKQGFSSYTYPSRSGALSSLYVMVDADLVSGEPSSSYGLVVGLHTDSGEFYAFMITEQGFWSIDLRKEGYWAPIQSGQSTIIVEGGNHLAVKGVKSDYIFYINHEQIAVVHDDRLNPNGRAGLIIGANYGGAESTFTFDDFTVLAP